MNEVYGDFMGKVIAGTTMSLDGFMNDRNGDVSDIMEAKRDV